MQPVAPSASAEAGETRLKQSRNQIAVNASKSLCDQTSDQEEMTMIKVGSKEEVALLLALFGVLNLPVQTPKKRS